MRFRSMLCGVRFLLASCLIVFAAGRAKADTYIFLSGMGGQVGYYDVDTKATTTLATHSSTVLYDIAFTPNGNLYGVNGNSPSNLYSINTSSGALSSSLGNAGNFDGSPITLNALGSTITTSNSKLIAAGGTEVYTVNTSNGAATHLNTLSTGHGINTVDYTSAGDITNINSNYYLTASRNDGSNNVLLQLDANGNITSVDTFNPSLTNVYGLVEANNTLYGFANGNVYTFAITGTSVKETQIGTTSFDVYGAAYSPSVVINAAVPEPSSLVLCGLAGLMGIGYRRYRSKRNAG
jgi:PEP-CTERM motif